MIVVFIAGGSASGKTELTTQPLEKLKALEINSFKLLECSKNKALVD